jgi:hypothetical protein
MLMSTIRSFRIGMRLILKRELLIQMLLEELSELNVYPIAITVKQILMTDLVLLRRNITMK